MMTETEKLAFDKLITDLATDPVIADAVKHIEAGPELTQNHYDQYGAILSTSAKGNKAAANMIALALIKAGANRAGVLNGLKNFV